MERKSGTLRSSCAPKHKTANDKEPAARQQACEIITRRGQMRTNLGKATWWDA